MNGSIANASVRLPEFSTATSSTLSMEPNVFKVTKIFFYFFILFCTTLGNAMVIYVICTSRKMRSSSNLLILNLAICDLLTPLISIPFDFALEENNYEWMYGRFMCKILYPGATLTNTLSSLTLAAISLDRYRIIMHPFKTRLSTRQIKLIILAIYLFSVCAVSPYVYVLQLQGSVCDELWPLHVYRKLYTMALFLIQYALPLIFMIIMYAFAVKNLYSASDKMRNNSIHNASMARRRDGERLDLESHKQKRRFCCCRKQENETQRTENPNARATKMFMAVVAVFAVFMFPNQVLWIWADYGNGSEQPIFQQASIICWLFTYTNGVVNPIIFAIFSKDFRGGFKDLFRIVFCCNRAVLARRAGVFEFLTRSVSTSSHTPSLEQMHGYKQVKRFPENASYCVYPKQHSMTKIQTLDQYPTSTQDNGVPKKLEVGKSPHPLKGNYFRDSSVLDSHAISSGDIGERSVFAEAIREPRRLSGPLTKTTRESKSPLKHDSDLLYRRESILENPLEHLDAHAIETLTDLPETEC